MIRLLKPFHNASVDLEGAVPIDAIVTFAKRPQTFNTVDHGENWRSQGFEHRMETKAIQWLVYLYIDLWIVKLDFRWTTPKELPPNDYPLPKDMPAAERRAFEIFRNGFTTSYTDKEK